MIVRHPDGGGHERTVLVDGQQKGLQGRIGENDPPQLVDPIGWHGRTVPGPLAAGPGAGYLDLVGREGVTRQDVGGKVQLRPAVPSDRLFLLSLYASTRADELAFTPWNDAEKAEFVRTQFEARERHYLEQFPDAASSVIVLEGRPVGRITVARQPDEIRVVDIAVLPVARSRGIGTRLLRDLADEGAAAGLPVRLHVETRSRARRLYDRLGFVQVGEVGDRAFLERPCATSTP